VELVERLQSNADFKEVVKQLEVHHAEQLAELVDISADKVQVAQGMARQAAMTLKLFKG